MLNCIFYKSFRHCITAIFSHFCEPARHTADRSRCFVGAAYHSKYCLRESRSVGATGLIHWFILEYRKRQEMNFCFDTLNIFVYNCSAYFRKFWKSIIQIYSDTLFSSFVCKVKFLRLSTLSHLLFTWSASHNWVRHKNDKPTTQMPHVGGACGDMKEIHFRSRNHLLTETSDKLWKRLLRISPTDYADSQVYSSHGVSEKFRKILYEENAFDTIFKGWIYQDQEKGQSKVRSSDVLVLWQQWYLVICTVYIPLHCTLLTVMFLRGDNGFRVSSQLFHYFNLPYENPFEFDVINRIFSRVIILHYQYQSKSPSSQLLDFYLGVS